MRNQQIKAIIKKDIGSLIANKRYFYTLLIIPFVFTVVIPTIVVLILKLSPSDSSDLQKIMQLLPNQNGSTDLATAALAMVMNQLMPLFFMMIPIMSASVMAGSSFVGEKEKRTLETLLYSPLSIKDIFQAKVLSSLIMSLAITAVSFIIMVVVVNVETFIIDRSHFMIGFEWLWVMLLLVPALTLIAITFIVRGSVKAQTMEEAQQRAAFLVLPIIVVATSQFSGLFLINPSILLIVGILLLAIAIILLQKATKNFTYESLIQ